MKEKNFLVARKVAHVLLFIVSLTFTLFLFIQFGSALHEKLLWGTVGIALEIIKLYLFMQAKSHWKSKELPTAGFQFLVYAGIAFVSMVASLGFALISIEGQSFTAAVSNIETDYLVEDIDRLNQEIDTKIRQQSELPTDYVTASDRFTDQIEELRLRKEGMIQLLQELQVEQVREDEAIDVFMLIGGTIGLSGRSTLYYLMLVMIIALELCLVMTAGNIQGSTMKPKLKTSSQLLVYLESLLNVDTLRLKPDERISKETGIPISECKSYRSTLANWVYKGKPLITQRQGGTKANFSAENMKKIVRFKIDTEV